MGVTTVVGIVSCHVTRPQVAVCSCIRLAVGLIVAQAPYGV